jgi:hypothetical protein
MTGVVPTLKSTAPFDLSTKDDSQSRSNATSVK